MEPSTHVFSPHQRNTRNAALTLDSPSQPPTHSTPPSSMFQMPLFKTIKDKLTAKSTVVAVNSEDMNHSKGLKNALNDMQKLSTNLINTTFASVLSDDTIWHDGVLAFYKIIKFLEDNLSTDLLPMEIRRVKAFEKDLSYYYGPNWKQHFNKDRETVESYLKQLEEVRSSGNVFLFAYAYQIYMGLMKQGPKLQQRRIIQHKLWNDLEPIESFNFEDTPTTSRGSEPVHFINNPYSIKLCPRGCAATTFLGKVPELKKQLRIIFNKIYMNMDGEVQQHFIDESRRAIIYNMQVLKSLKGETSIFGKSPSVVIATALAVIISATFCLKQIFSKPPSPANIY